MKLTWKSKILKNA